MVNVFEQLKAVEPKPNAFTQQLAANSIASAAAAATTATAWTVGLSVVGVAGAVTVGAMVGSMIFGSADPEQPSPSSAVAVTPQSSSTNPTTQSSGPQAPSTSPAAPATSNAASPSSARSPRAVAQTPRIVRSAQPPSPAQPRLTTAPLIPTATSPTPAIASPSSNAPTSTPTPEPMDPQSDARSVPTSAATPLPSTPLPASSSLTPSAAASTPSGSDASSTAPTISESPIRYCSRADLGRVGETTLSDDGRLVWTLTVTNISNAACLIDGQLVAEISVDAQSVESLKANLDRVQLDSQSVLALRFEFGHRLSCADQAEIGVAVTGEDWGRLAGRPTQINCPA